MFSELDLELPHQEAHDVPSYRDVRDEGYGKPSRFRLASDDYNHEVQVLWLGGRYNSPDRGYGFGALVCPVETIDTTRQGTRFVYVTVDLDGNATWL